MNKAFLRAVLWVAIGTPLMFLDLAVRTIAAVKRT
jgi:hypothetical protein